MISNMVNISSIRWGENSPLPDFEKSGFLGGELPPLKKVKNIPATGSSYALA